MSENLIEPDYIFETSWEVCNKIGGIYTVLSTQAKTLQRKYNDRLIFIGPDFPDNKDNPQFIEDFNLCIAWKEHAIAKDKLKVRVGRWNIPGKPLVILVDFSPFFLEKNYIYGKMWEYFQVDSLHSYGDYDEASMFSFAAGKVAESFYKFNLSSNDKVIYHAHEWMTGLGALYLQKKVPEIATVFTTHATSIGRSIAGNNKPLYQYLSQYDGDQMARELNMESKHSIEKQTAHYVDCFTTVSEITNQECKELLYKEADAILVNGFEDSFVPKNDFAEKRAISRKKILEIASGLMGKEFSDDTIIVATSGRNEFKNKGIDLFIESLNKLRYNKSLKKDVLALITVPAWVESAREDLKDKINKNDGDKNMALENPFISHNLYNMNDDNIIRLFHQINITNDADSKVNYLFIPCYLNGNDGIVDINYYDLMPGFDLTVYPSYYEPWGYTPLESIAFGIPTITTDLAGFGLWANSVKKENSELVDGVKVVHRDDFNYNQAEETIMNSILEFSSFSKEEISNIQKKAVLLSNKALWKNFIKNYYKAYNDALINMEKRLFKTMIEY